MGEKVAIDIVNSAKNKEQSTKKAVVVALSGDLGSGKTTFLQGFAKSLGINQRILSPTFILMRQYDIKLKAKSSLRAGPEAKLKVFYHIDLYRLENSVEKELVNLGFNEITSDPSNIIAIEWAEKAEDVYSKDTIWIKFESKGENMRKISIR